MPGPSIKVVVWPSIKESLDKPKSKGTPLSGWITIGKNDKRRLGATLSPPPTHKQSAKGVNAVEEQVIDKARRNKEKKERKHAAKAAQHAAEVEERSAKQKAEAAQRMANVFMNLEDDAEDCYRAGPSMASM